MYIYEALKLVRPVLIYLQFKYNRVDQNLITSDVPCFVLGLCLTFCGLSCCRGRFLYGNIKDAEKMFFAFFSNPQGVIKVNKWDVYCPS